MTASHELPSEEHVNFLFITSNVGSLFENRLGIEDVWMNEISHLVNKHEPQFLAIHFQETGGKDCKSSFEPVQQFAKKLIDCKWLKDFNIARGFFDGNVNHVHEYTALGSIYFVHNSIKRAHIYSYKEEKFVEVSGKEVFFKDICSLPDIKKEKFKQNFFPDYKWSRKGYCRVRWKIYDKVVEFINVHLFHDDNNLVSLKTSPSLYAGNRKRALKFVLKRLKEEYPIENDAFFLFGDFNFRLDVKSLIKDLCPSYKKQVIRQKDDDAILRIIFRKEEEDDANGTCQEGSDANGKVPKVVAKFEKKYFDIDQSLFDPSSGYKRLRSYDNELHSSKTDLREMDISFQPTYPFSEDVEKPGQYMATRCPSWCDRILLPGPSWEWLHPQKSHSKAFYNSLGASAFVGDHKPVYLAFRATCSNAKSTSKDKTKDNGTNDSPKPSETNGTSL